MRKIFTLFVIALFGISQINGEILYGKVAVGSGKGEASVEIHSNYFDALADGPYSTTTSTQVQAQATNVALAWAYCKFSATAATGYTFDGWYTNSACSQGKQTSNPYSTSSAKGVDRTDEYWAKFTPNTYKVTFNPEGGSVSPTTKNVTFDSTYGEGGWPTPTRTGYKFEGWFKSDGTTKVEASTAVTTASNLALYAHWTLITYKVAFDGNGSTEGSMENQEFTYDETKNLSANAFEQKYTVSFDAKVSEVAAKTAEYTFVGWATSADGEKQYDNEQSVSNLTTEDNATIQLFALWNTGSIALPSVEKEGYQFEGWFLNETKIGDADFDYVPTANVTLTAHWKSFGTEEISFCEGGSEEYNGTTYTTATTEVVTLNTKNQYDGDSIVTLTVTVLQPTTGTDTKTITVGDDEIWNSIALKDSTVGVHTVVTTLTNVAGCDSTVTLTLTVNKIATLEKDEPLVFCANDSAQFRGKWYFKSEDSENISAEGATRDTLYKVMVTVLDTNMISEQKTITEGDDVEWNYIALKDSVAGTYTIVYETSNIAGCDSTVTLTLTVKAKENQGGTTGLENIQRSDVDVQKFFRNGVMYIRRGETLYGLDGKRVE